MNEEPSRLPKAVLDAAVTFMLAGFGFVAALAWNEAIQSLFNWLFGTAGSLIAKFGYAILVTAIITAISLRLGRTIGPKP